MRKRLFETAARLESAVKQVRIIPAGANDPIPPVPDEIIIDESDLEDISALWDETMPEYAGMLDAEIVRRRNAEQ